MASRDAILENIRKSLASGRRDGETAAGVAARLKSHPRGVVPAGPAEAGPALERFLEKARLAAASAQTVSRGEVASAVAAWLREHNLPKRVRMGADARLAAVDWNGEGLEFATGPSDGGDITGVSHAFGGVAETGTLVLASGPDNPTTLNFLPENHVVLVEAGDIVANYESIWERLRERYGPGAMPRTVNMVTGPSRSADIEQTLILGAHGPVRLHILVVGD